MNKNLNKGVSTIGIIVVLVIAATIAGGIYFYLNSQQPKIENNPPTSSNQKSEVAQSPTPSEKPLSELSPKEMWLKYRGEFDKIKNMDEGFIVSRKYISSDMVAQLDAQKEQFNKMAQSEKNNWFALVKVMVPPPENIKADTITANIVGSEATLTVEAINIKDKGEISLVKEKGIWKIRGENWQGE